MKNSLQVEFEDGDARAGIARVHGNLDPHSAPLFAEQCRRFKEQGRHLVLNLSGVTFLSSSGIGALLVVVDEFRQRGLSVRLADISPAARSVMRVLNLDHFLDIRPTETEALESMEAA